MFIVGASISFGWEIILLISCMRSNVPNTSLFPEIDFTSKVLAESIAITDSASAYGRLSTLGNGGSAEVLRRLRNTRLYTRDVSTNSQLGEIGIILEPSKQLLSTGRKYK